MFFSRATEKDNFGFVFAFMSLFIQFIYFISIAVVLTIQKKVFLASRKQFCSFLFTMQLIVHPKVTYCIVQGTVKQELAFIDMEGDPLVFDINESFLVVGTTKNVVKIYDLSRR